jgi:hypothetical protein
MEDWVSAVTGDVALTVSRATQRVSPFAMARRAAFVVRMSIYVSPGRSLNQTNNDDAAEFRSDGSPALVIAYRHVLPGELPVNCA